jgi:hypothetical protein
MRVEMEGELGRGQLLGLRRAVRLEESELGSEESQLQRNQGSTTGLVGWRAFRKVRLPEADA